MGTGKKYHSGRYSLTEIDNLRDLVHLKLKINKQCNFAAEETDSILESITRSTMSHKMCGLVIVSVSTSNHTWNTVFNYRCGF